MRLKRGDQSFSVSTINYQDESRNEYNMDLNLSDINKESPAHSLDKKNSEKILEIPEKVEEISEE